LILRKAQQTCARQSAFTQKSIHDKRKLSMNENMRMVGDQKN